MDLSKKLLLTSCICAAFLAGAAGCMLEEQNLEEKELFKCADDSDCLKGSVCVKASQNSKIGSCVREEDVDHCHDYDKDGFMAADENYEYQCGFSESNPADADDSNPNVNPTAAELCDGLDNDQDGCVDGTCATGKDCTGEDKSHCQRLFRPCVGNVLLSDMLAFHEADNTVKSVCSPIYIGGRFCVPSEDPETNKKTGKWEYRMYNPEGRADYENGGDLTEMPGEGYELGLSYVTQKFDKCPTEDDVRYMINEGGADISFHGNGYDEDCDGEDVKGSECVEPDQTNDKASLCFIHDSNNLKHPVYVPTDADFEDALSGAMDNCNGKTQEECGCFGRLTCAGKTLGNPVCMKNGIELNKAKIHEMQQNNDAQYFWGCLK